METLDSKQVANLLEQAATFVLRRAERIVANEERRGEADTSLAAELTFESFLNFGWVLVWAFENP